MSDNMDYADADSEREEDVILARQNQWAGGYHTTSANKHIALSDMPTPHLQNTINKFKDTHDVSALDAELAKRAEVNT